MKYKNEQEELDVLEIQKRTNFNKKDSLELLKEHKTVQKVIDWYFWEPEDQICSICGLGPAASCCRIML